MKKLFIIVLSFLLSITEMPGQDAAGQFMAAQKLFEKAHYSEALSCLLILRNSDSLNASTNFKIGVCYFYSRSQKSKAIKYFEEAALLPSDNYTANSQDERNAPLVVFKFLGDTYHLLYKFDEAILNYKKFIELSHAEDQSIIDDAVWKIEMCEIGKQLSGLAIKPITLKKAEAENALPGKYTAEVSPDQSKMIFTFQKMKNGRSNNDDLFYDDTYVTSVKDTMLPNDAKKNRNNNEVTIASSTDGQIILNYRDIDGIANLYTSYLKGNEWSAPEKLDRPVNPAGWEQEEYISADGAALYFTSSRKGGYGGKDIYKCKKLPEGAWGKAVNLGPAINTPYDEEAPLILPDGVTLYFSSNGHKNPGRFDILSSSLTNNDFWSVAAIVGFPIDTAYDVASNDLQNNSLQNKAARTKKNKNKKPVNIDASETSIGKTNYMVTFSKPKSQRFTILKGEIIDENEAPVSDVKITVRDIETNAITGVYYPERAGGYAFILPPNKNNNISYDKNGYLIYSDNRNIIKDTNYLEIYQPVKLLPAAINAATALNNIFFIPDNAALRSISSFELDKLYDYLAVNRNLTVELTGSSNLTGSYKTNWKLSKERAEEAANYLIRKGIGKERIAAKGLSKEKWNSKRSSNYKNTASNEGVEMKILGIDSEKDKALTIRK